MTTSRCTSLLSGLTNIRVAISNNLSNSTWGKKTHTLNYLFLSNGTAIVSYSCPELCSLQLPVSTSRVTNALYASRRSGCERTSAPTCNQIMHHTSTSHSLTHTSVVINGLCDALAAVHSSQLSIT